MIATDDEVINHLNEEIKFILNKKRDLSSFTELVNTSYLTQCNRRIIYRISGTSIEENILYCNSLNELNNSLLKEKWIKLFESIKYVEIIHRNELFADCNFNLSARMDIVKIGKKHVIFEVEQVNDEEFLSANSDGPKRSSIVDIIAKMWLSEISHGVLIYDCISNYKIFHIKPYEPIIKSFCSKCSLLFDYKIKEKLPDRNYINDYSEECKICEYKQLCWNLNNKKTGENSA